MISRCSTVLQAILLLFVTLPSSAQDVVSARFVPGEESVWVIEVDGNRLGEHLFRYEGAVTLTGGIVAHRFTGQARLTVPGIENLDQLYTADLLTDGEGHPIRHELRARLGDSVSRVEIRVAEGKGSAIIEQGPTRRTLEFDVPRESYLLPNNFVGFLEIFLRKRAPTPDDPVVTTLVSPNIARALPYRVVWKEAITDEDGRNEGIRVSDSLGEVIDLSPEGRVLRIEIPAQKVLIRRSGESVEPFTIGDPVAALALHPDIEAADVAIVHDDVSLAGTVTRRRGAVGRLPAVFLVSGSGAQDRNGYSMGVDTGAHEILDRLTLEGFLVMRVDDRGAGQSEGPVGEMDYDALVADARACVDYLAKRPDVDPKRIALIGHSEGAVTVPLIALERGDIAAVVLMAGPGRPMIDVIMDQNAMALDDAGIEQAERAKTLSEIREALVRVSGDGEVDPESLPPDVRPLLAVRGWLQDHARVDVLGNVSKLHCPVLLLQGEKDFQVSPQKDARALEKALRDAGVEVTLHVFPGLDHLFKESPGERSRLADYFESRPVDPKFLDVLSDWLSEKLHSEASE